ncbi:MAG: hypothetical protein GY716_02665 [bacterium]|nr:hypothetical protein [bacterium]
MTTEQKQLETAREPRTRVRRVFAILGEFLAALVLVLLCFSLLTGLLVLSFPQGTSIANVMTFGSRPEVRAGRTLIDTGLEAEEEDDAFTAFISEVFHQVKEKRSGAIVWGDAKAGIRLKDRHAVQSFSNSGATISFDDQNDLTLGEKSLIIIRGLKRDRDSRRRAATLVVLEGELDGRLEGRAGRAMRVEIATAKSTLRIDGRRQTADFKVAIGEDHSSTYSIYEGTAKVVTGSKTIVLEPNQTVTVDPEGKAGGVRELPGIPQPMLPADEMLFSYRAAPPTVRFDWMARKDVDGYRFALARDPGFLDLIYKDTLAQPGFAHGNLRSGVYYWKISGVSQAAEGPHSDVRRIEIIHDSVPPALDVEFPTGVIEMQNFLLRGSAEPGSRVFVGDQPVSIEESGAFELALQLERGLNVIVVEAVDSAGNIAYESQLISAKY